MINKKIIFTLTMILVIMVCPMVIPFVPNQQFQDFVFRKIFIIHVAKNILRESRAGTENYLESNKVKFLNKNISDNHRKIMTIFRFVSFNMQPDYYDKSFDISPEGILIYGSGWCDSQAYLLASLLDTCMPITTRLIDVQHHTTLEIFVDDGWKIYDSFFKTYILDENNRLLGLRDIKNFTSDQLKLASTALITTEDVKKIYVPNELRYPLGEGDVLFNNGNSIIRKVINYVIVLGEKIYGNKFLEFCEEIYLHRLNLDNLHNQFNRVMQKSCADCKKIDFLNYFKARAFFLTGNKLQSDRHLSYIAAGSYWKLRFDLLAARGSE